MTDVALTPPSPPVLPAGLTLIGFRDGERLLCQHCGWTRSLPKGGRAEDNESHAIAHLRADVLLHRFHEGSLPLWGFAISHLGTLTGNIHADPYGTASIAALGRLDDGRMQFSLDGFPRSVGRFSESVNKSGFPSRFAWCDADVIDDVLSQLLRKRLPATRKHVRKVRSLASLVAREIPVWIAAGAVRGPKWARAPYQIEQLSDVQKCIVAAEKMLPPSAAITRKLRPK